MSWITYASYRSSSNNKEDEMFEYADDHFSLRAFCDNCVGQPGQTCDSAVQTLVNFYETDRDEFYEIISKNPIYRSGWGVQVPGDNTGNCVVPSSIPGYSYENGDPPDPGGEDYREWIADQGANQDRAYAAYNELRDDRNSLSRTARGMTMVALVNHVVSAWDAFMAARGVNAVAHGFKAHVGRQIEMDLKVKGSIGNPGARFVLRRKF